MVWMLAGVAALSSLFGDKDQNEALKRKQMARISIYKSKEVMTQFAVSNNLQRANEIALQQAAETAEIGRQVVVEERKAISKETIRRGEGLTAGISVSRSIDDVIATGNKAKAEVLAKSEQAFMQLHGEARDANARELASLDDSYHNMVAGINEDQAQKKSGLEMLFGATMAGASGAVAGANVSAIFKKG